LLDQVPHNEASGDDSIGSGMSSLSGMEGSRVRRSSHARTRRRMQDGLHKVIAAQALSPHPHPHPHQAAESRQGPGAQAAVLRGQQVAHSSLGGGHAHAHYGIDALRDAQSAQSSAAAVVGTTAAIVDLADTIGQVGTRFLPSERFGAFMAADSDASSIGSGGGSLDGSPGRGGRRMSGAGSAGGGRDVHSTHNGGPGSSALSAAAMHSPGRFSSEPIEGKESKFPMYQY
jgi:hypothetical protein